MSIENEESLFLAHIKELLDEQGLNHETTKFADGSELLSFKFLNDDDKELNLMARATPDDIWLYIFGGIGNLMDFNSKVEVVHSLMQLNMVLLGVKTALNDNNDILLMTATNNSKLTSKEFEDILDNIDFASVEIFSIFEEFS